MNVKAELISRALGQPVGPWLRERHAAGTSWRGLVHEIYKATGYEVTHESLRTWSKG